MLRFIASLSVVSVISLAACQPAPVGVRNLSVAPDSAPQCASLCQQVGMSLDSLVIMADNVGCVCELPSAPPPSPAKTGQLGTPPAGMATIAAQQAAAAMLQQEQQRRRQMQRF